MKTKAINSKDKEQRQKTILDAAEMLWQLQPECVPSVAKIASAAGIAKGTVYFYFHNKEELFFAIYERYLETFFDRIKARSSCIDQAMTLDELFTISRQFLLDFPNFLSIAVLCHNLPERGIYLENEYFFNKYTHKKLARIINTLKKQFPHTPQTLMLQSYALFLGLWLLIHPSLTKEQMKGNPSPCTYMNYYLSMLEAGLKNLWRGVLMNPEKT